MAITRWRPFEDLMNIEDEISKFFDDFLGQKLQTRRQAREGWIPRVDISENDDEITVRADIPGMKKEDVKITLSENVLTISGDKRVERDEKKDNYHRIERLFGKFSRSFYIPTNVDPANISAKYNNGVLEIKLPKKEEAKPKEIPIEVE
ncbi:Hsp20/alpha crystallin family protein [bacterium]|nr:MAG: Hsp20/alpha crystallin family protein [bacterium]